MSQEAKLSDRRVTLGVTEAPPKGGGWERWERTGLHSGSMQSERLEGSFLPNTWMSAARVGGKHSSGRGGDGAEGRGS